MSNIKYFSSIFYSEFLRYYSILLRLCCAHALVRARKPRPLLTAKWIYLYDFLTFTDKNYTCDVISYALRKTRRLKCIKQHKYSLFAMVDRSDP